MESYLILFWPLRYNLRMVMENDIQEKVQRELDMAYQAREDGYEGRARVCARRAAGFAVEHYLQQRDVTPPTSSVYGLLEMLESTSGLPEDIQESLHFLTLRVNEDHELPREADLIRASKALIEFLFPH